MQSAKSPPHVEPGMHRKSQPLFQGLSILSKPPSSQQDAGWVGCPSCVGEAVRSGPQKHGAYYFKQSWSWEEKHEIKATLWMKFSLTWCYLQLKLPLNLTNWCLALIVPEKKAPWGGNGIEKNKQNQKAPQIFWFSVKASLQVRRGVWLSQSQDLSWTRRQRSPFAMEGPHCRAFSKWCHQHQDTSPLSFGKNLFLMSKLRLGQQRRGDLAGEPHLLLSSLVELLWRRWQNFWWIGL